MSDAVVPSAPSRGSRRHRIEHALHRAEARGELSLHYQPIRDARSHALSGAEALLRFEHPELGVVSPAEFIPAAEDSGLIVPIGAWAIGSAARQAALWADAGRDRRRAALLIAVAAALVVGLAVLERLKPWREEAGPDFDGLAAPASQPERSTPSTLSSAPA